MATTKDSMGLRISVLLGAGLTVMLALVLSLGASEASAASRPTPDDQGHWSQGSTGGTFTPPPMSLLSPRRLPT